ncbi:MAG: ABC transporter substrate-binding protein [Saprospiraceae bacterium]
MRTLIGLYHPLATYIHPFFQPMQQLSFKFSTALLFLLIVFSSCRKPSKEHQEDFTVRVRLAADPGKLSPLLSLNGYAEQVQKNLFLSLQEFDPKDYSLRPVLITQPPQYQSIDTGMFAGGVAYHFEILAEAEWDDGTAVLANDYVFSLKAMFNPSVAGAAPYRSFFDFVGDVIIDENNPKKFSILTNKSYILAEAALSSIAVYPAAVYDSEDLMKSFSIPDLQKGVFTEEDQKNLASFAEKFESQFHTTDPKGIIGCGPYALTEWESGQQILLQKKKNWWGDKLAARYPELQAIPEEIRYQIIPDNAAALTALKNGQLDVVSDINPQAFTELQQNNYVKEKFKFHTPPYLSYSYIALNRNRPALNDPKVRRALAHLVDVEQIIKSNLFGLAQRVTGPIHPSKSFYNHKLAPISFDTKKAIELLNEAGWTDSDKDGLLDKMIKGKKEYLNLDYLYSSDNEIGVAVAELLKQEAKRVGIDINIKGMEFRAAVKAYRSREYDLAFFLWSKLPGPQDMKQIWHTSSDTPNGGNRTGFGDQASDLLIDSIRTTLDEERRKDLYLRIQKRIYDDQPYIFLFAPLERIAISKKIEAETSALRPGFSVRHFEQSGKLDIQNQ